jgi:hypothetical protein
MKNDKSRKCPICNHYTFTEDEIYEVCPVCDWEDDPIQRDDPDFKGGANELSLNEYRVKWLTEHNVRAS